MTPPRPETDPHGSGIAHGLSTGGAKGQRRGGGGSGRVVAMFLEISIIVESADNATMILGQRKRIRNIVTSN